MNCPKCDKKMEWQKAEPDTGIDAGWFCYECGEHFSEWEFDTEPTITDRD